ncbi:carbohydrate kinase family protein [Magnetospirillum sp. UT-4]|uniref:carbohydrate kinase family protein n=1 Tax=Magnetospirillum sp. UT-4 TaxID=2681467 RepID=UPI00137EE4F1|nr:PfkB family carbohydrate kinase [Magnetospirillum sp. UT-4]CAA7624306.1 hypothetical protein MTBUT4_60006 [Magnetospirillum sp. UT-4]
MSVQTCEITSRADAIAALNRQPKAVAISLLWSQTVDLFAARVDEALRPALNGLRRLAPDGVKVAVESIEREMDGWRVLIDGGTGDEMMIPDEAIGDTLATPGGGLCNLAQDVEVIRQSVGEFRHLPPVRHLSWADSAEQFGAEAVPGRSRTSLVLKDDGFDKLILTERGPSWDRAAIDPLAIERAFYDSGDAVLFVGQEPVDSKKFEEIRRRKLADPALRVYWLVGGNQLKRLFTEYRDFLSVVDVVSLNLAEAAGFFGFEPLRKRHRDSNELRKMYAKEIARRALELGANHVVITDGAKGASLARKARGGHVEFVYSPLIHENTVAVDPTVREDTGCGDSFAAAVATYFLASPARFKLNEAANFAHYVAGIVYQRRRPKLTREDVPFIAEAHARARACGALVGHHEAFDRTRCQIRPADMICRGPARKVLVLLTGGDPTDPAQPHVSGAAAAIERLAEMCRTGAYGRAPLIRIVPRVTTNPAARGHAGYALVDRAEMQRLAFRESFRKELGNPEGEPRNGVLASDLEGHEGVYLLRVTILEAIEVLSSEDFRELFGDIKFWHFATENIDERIAWHARNLGVTREQGQEIMRQALRDYVIEEMGAQYRFSHARATNLDEFQQEMTEQLIFPLDALLMGMFRGAV